MRARAMIIWASSLLAVGDLDDTTRMNAHRVVLDTN
jgi:hypothetical protein